MIRPPKEAVMEAAVTLFHTKGYAGTSVRDIAGKAKVNVATISYYFHGKQGLLEACLIHFFEGYLACLEREMDRLETEEPAECLKRALRSILQFQSEHHLLARFVWREVSIDSQVAREVISSYLMKERFMLKTIIEAAARPKVQSHHAVSMMIIQLKGMLMMPFLNSQYVTEVWHIFPQEKFFVDRYSSAVECWLEEFLPEKAPCTA